MDQITNSRNEFILGLSLSELAFLYFMLLLLISLFMMKEHKAKIDERDETIEQQNIVITGLKREDFDPQTWMVDIKKLKEGNYALKKEIERLKEQIFEGEELEKFDQITSELKLEGLDNEQFEAKLKELKELVDENEKLVVENTAFKNKIELADKRFGKGWDYPPCFLNKNGTSNEYIYEIDIYKTKYVIRPAWPKDKHGYVSKIPGVSLFSGELTKKIDDFKVFGSKLKEDARNNECRHYVKVYDKTPKTSKLSWQKNLRILESYFYKKCIGC